MICKNCFEKIDSDVYDGETAYFHTSSGMFRCDGESSQRLHYKEVILPKAEPFDEKDYFNNLIDTYYEIQSRG